MNLHKVEFIRSAAKPSDLIQDGLPQIAFAGKSNVGKSSVINRLLQRKTLLEWARRREKPCMSTIFWWMEGVYLVDLPGYGYAKVSREEKERWSKLMEAYFAQMPLHLGVLLVDARHNPTRNDCTMADWFLASGCPFVVVANKLDKVKKTEIEPNLTQIRQDLKLPADCPVIPFSAEKGDGRETLLRHMLSVVQE